jgi:hypothetical protein
LIVKPNSFQSNCYVIPFDGVLDKKGNIWSTGDSQVAYVNSYAQDLDEAIKQLYLALSGIRCFGHMWRDDIGAKWTYRQSSPILQSHVVRRKKVKGISIRKVEKVTSLIAEELALIDVEANASKEGTEIWESALFKSRCEKNCDVWIAYENSNLQERPVGFVVVKHNKNGLEIYNLSATVRGVGKKMLKLAISKQPKGSNLTLQCVDALIPYYQKAGFQVKHSRPNNNRLVYKWRK